MIFFSLIAKTDPKRSQTEPNGTETEPKRSRNGPKSSFSPGWDGRGGFVGVGGVGGCKGKRISLLYFPGKGETQTMV